MKDLEIKYSTDVNGNINRVDIEQDQLIILKNIIEFMEINQLKEVID